MDPATSPVSCSSVLLLTEPRIRAATRPCVSITRVEGMALGFRRLLGGLAFVRRHHVWVTRAGGALLVLVGIAMVTGLWDSLIDPMRQWVSNFSTVV